MTQVGLTGDPNAPKTVPNVLREEFAVLNRQMDYFGYRMGNYLYNPEALLRTNPRGVMLGLRLFDDILLDCHAAGVLRNRFMAVAGLPWKIIPAANPISGPGRPLKKSRSKEIADFVTNALMFSPFNRLNYELMQAILFGVYGAEVLWTLRGRKIVPYNFIPRHPKQIKFTLDRGLNILTVQDMIYGIPVPKNKFIIFTWGDSENPYGKGLGATLWWPVWFKKNALKFWLTYLERFGQPTVVGKYPPGTPPEDQAKLMTALESIQTETGLKIPDTMTLELLEAKRQGSADYKDLCGFLDDSMSKAVLGQTLTTQVGSKGALATAKVQENIRHEIVKLDSDMLAETHNHNLIPMIVDLNFPGVDDYPTLVFDAKPPEDTLNKARAWATLISAGTEITQRQARDEFSIWERQEDEPIMTPIQKIPQPVGGGGGTGESGGKPEDNKQKEGLPK